MALDSTITSGLIAAGSALSGSAITAYFAYRVHGRALLAAKDERVREQQDAILAALADGIGRVLRHVRDVPGSRISRRNRSLEEQERLRAAEDSWERELMEILAPLEVSVLTVRDESARATLAKAIELLRNWRHLGTAYSNYGQVQIDPSSVLSDVAAHAVECLGALRREDSLPDRNEGFVNACDAWETFLWDQRELERAEREQRNSW
ncbi:hypothetical protein [Streptomyces sp. NBRC 109706]|uniref:hypothetical protein n=1 Tax=Streptomyces sp. NBRC 109706 TaxID=1550035 RepID=UPI00131DE5D8|nr:hypothetical protein [Streptomyces sp. NBRC 109706]